MVDLWTFFILHQQEMRQKCVGGTNHGFSGLHTPVNFCGRKSGMEPDKVFSILPYLWHADGIAAAHKATLALSRRG